MLKELNSPDRLQVFSDLLRAMVDDPHALKIEIERSSEEEAVLRVQAPEGEIGKLIGVAGRSARSLRTILAALGKASGQRYSFDLTPR